MIKHLYLSTQALFESDITILDPADQINVINLCIEYFLLWDIKNNFLITNLLVEIVEFTFEKVKNNNKYNTSINYAYPFTFQALQLMYQNHAKDSMDVQNFLSEYKSILIFQLSQ